MKNLMMSLMLGLVFSCSTAKEKTSWNGAQRQQQMEDTTQMEQQEQFKNQQQQPGMRNF